MKDRKTVLFGAVMIWTVVTSVFAWLPLVRILARPEGYRWRVLGLTGEGTDGPTWVFAAATAYAVVLLWTAHRGPRVVFYPLLVLWHLGVTAIVAAGIVQGGAGATVQGEGLRWSLPLWLVVIPSAACALVALVWAVADRDGGGDRRVTTRWTRHNTRRLTVSAVFLAAAWVLFSSGTNYDAKTAAAIVATVLHWILLGESFQVLPRDPDGPRNGVSAPPERAAGSVTPEAVNRLPDEG